MDVELLQIGAPPPIDRLPVDAKGSQRLLGRRQKVARTRGFPLEKLARLERVEQRHRAPASAEPRRESVEIDHCAVAQRRA